MSLPTRSFDTPLANNTVGVEAIIPDNHGQSIEFRKFAEFDPPDEFDQKSEPASDQLLQAVVVEVPVKELVDKTSLGNLLMRTDYVNLMEESFEKFVKALGRGIHRNVNNRLVNGLTDTGLFEGTGDFSALGLRTFFVGELTSFGQLVEDSYYRMADFELAALRLANDGVPPAFDDDTYLAVVSHSIIQQLRADDPDFREVVSHSDDQNDGILGEAKLMKYGHLTFMKQHDAYRANLPTAGGALATRALLTERGRVEVCHILGRGAYAYVDLASSRKERVNAMPKFKVQDITVTGNNTTLGYRVPFRSVVIDRDYGINLAGTTKFWKGVAD